MKRILSTSIFIGLLCLLITEFGEVFAQGGLEEAPLVKILGTGGVFEKLANVLFSLLVAASVILFIYAGFLFITAAGDPQKFDTAKKAVLYGIIGLIIALSARGIVNLIEGILIPEPEIEIRPRIPVPIIEPEETEGEIRPRVPVPIEPEIP